MPSVCEADEGAIIERFLCRAQRPGAPILEVCAGNFAAAAATYFAHVGKVGKTPPGTRPMDYGSAMLRLGP